MNHCVPEFNMDDDYSLPSSSGILRPKNMQEDEIMELLWENGQVVLQSQNPLSHRKSPPPPPPPPQAKLSHHHQQRPAATTTAPPPTSGDSSTHLFMQEDEMVSWLQYPLEDPSNSFDRDLTDLFYNQASRPPPPNPSSAAPALKPPLPPPPTNSNPHQQAPISSRPENFPQFSRMAPRIPDTGASSSRNNDPRESTVVDSSDTPAMRQKSKIHPPRSAVEVSGGGNRGCNSFSGGGGGAVGGCMSVGMSRNGETCDLTLTSSPDGSGASASATATADLMTLPPAYDRKRKGREPVDDATTEYQSEYAEIESYEAKKQARGGVGTKRSRASEVHNLSERRRRDRINEKMKALQELIPRCSKTDKASMLDEAIEYLKSLQLQVQMMSMGCGMVPVMFPGIQQYMPSMGMGMRMGMARPMMQFPAVLSGSSLPTPGAQSHWNPRFPLHTFPMQPIPGLDPSRIQQASHSMARIPNLADPYQQQCVSIQQMQIPQNQPTSHPNSCNPSTSKG